MTRQEDRDELNEVERQILMWCSEKKVKHTPVNVIQAMFDLHYATWLFCDDVVPMCDPET